MQSSSARRPGSEIPLAVGPRLLVDLEPLFTWSSHIPQPRPSISVSGILGLAQCKDLTLAVRRETHEATNSSAHPVSCLTGGCAVGLMGIGREVLGGGRCADEAIQLPVILVSSRFRNLASNAIGQNKTG